MLELKSETKFYIKDRGWAHSVKLPESVYMHRDPRTLVGETVKINGTEYEVKGVGAHAIPWTPGKLKTVELLV